jgi:ribose-phosphate pyrophosphokinase
VVVTNTMSTVEKETECSRLKSLSIADLLAEAIKRIHNEDSVSSLFET